MSLDVDVASDRVRGALGRNAIAQVARRTLRAERVRNALVSITLVDRNAIARLNRRHLGHRGATDVISFAFRRERDRDPVVGDIYIAPDVARENAVGQGISVREELVRLIVHGVLHVLGYDHPDDAEHRLTSLMWRRQEAIVRRVRATARRGDRS